MQFSSPSHHFIPLRSKYSPKHPVLLQPQSVTLNVRDEFSHSENHRKNCSLVYSNSYVSSTADQKTEGSGLNDSKGYQN
jgi:hypothetical protein